VCRYGLRIKLEVPRKDLQLLFRAPSLSSVTLTDSARSIRPPVTLLYKPFLDRHITKVACTLLRPAGYPYRELQSPIAVSFPSHVKHESTSLDKDSGGYQAQGKHGKRKAPKGPLLPVSQKDFCNCSQHSGRLRGPSFYGNTIAEETSERHKGGGLPPSLGTFAMLRRSIGPDRFSEFILPETVRNTHI
jgi:hypothetical protein